MKQPAIPRPFLKWAGGKGKLTGELLKRRPLHFGVYHEPFLGGGAMFFRLRQEGLIRRAILSDINRELIDTYIAIRDHVGEVIRILSEFPYSKEFYYQLRKKDPWKLDLAERAARMIYLNKTGYNGLYRVNRRGEFNVPFGRYKSPKYLDRDNLLAVSRALQDVEILHTPFHTVVDRALPGDWVYFDPPYVPLSQTANFTSYHENGFSLKDHEKLRDICLTLSENRVYVLVSNSDTPIVRALYSTEYFFLDRVWANRFINSKGDGRGKVPELLIANYPFPVPEAAQQKSPSTAEQVYPMPHLQP